MSRIAPEEQNAEADREGRDRIQRAFGLVLRRLRDERGLSQEDLAAASGVGRSFIAKLELGPNQPSLTTLFRLAGALGVPPEDVVSRVGQEAS